MKPSWVLSEDERQRRFRKNRERGGQEGQDQPPQPGQVVSSHKKERNSQSSSSVPELPLESIDEALLASMMEQQQHQQQTFVVKTEPRVQQVSPSILEQKREPEIVKTETKPGSFVSTAGQHNSTWSRRNLETAASSWQLQWPAVNNLPSWSTRLFLNILILLRFINLLELQQ